MEKEDTTNKRAITEKEREVIKTALERYEKALSGTSDIRKDYLEDTEFAAGKHWTDQDVKDRKDDKRPCLTINKLMVFINRVVNDQKQNRLSIKYRPFEDSDKEKSEVITGLVRHIMNDSHASSAFDMAHQNAVTGGLGWFRILTDYIDSETFDQEIKIERVANTLSVVAPIHLCKRADFSDMRYLFFVETVSKDEFKLRYPNIEMSNWESTSPLVTQWIDDDSVVIVEYFEVRSEKGKLYRLEDGSVVETLEEGQVPVVSRETIKKSVYWRKMCGGAILEGGEEGLKLDTKYIPVIGVAGQEINIEGKMHLISLIRNAKDPQRMYNYWRTCETETIALSPKAPIMGAKGQFTDKKWKTANVRNHAYLEYEVTDAAGRPLPAPQRLAPPTIPTGYVNAASEANEDIKSTTGIFDASLGAKGNETTGRAIMARQRQGDIGNFHFTDNLSLAISHAGRIILDMIPKVYDTARAVRILGDDMKDEVVRINEPSTRKDKTVLYDLTVGKYDVVADVGPSYATKRMEAADSLSQFITAYPAAAQACGDIIARNMDFPGAEELADRLLKMVPPELLEKEGEQNTKIRLMQAVKQNQQMQQMIQELDKVITRMQAELENKDKDREVTMDKAILESETKIEIERMRVDMAKMKMAHDALIKQINERFKITVPAIGNAEETQI